MIDAVSTLVLAIEEDREDSLEPRSVEDIAFDVAREYPNITARELLAAYYAYMHGGLNG